MNKVILMGRLVKDPDIRYTQSDEPLAVARYTLAVDRIGSAKETDSKSTDFINCVAFGWQAEFAEKYLFSGIKILITGRIQTGNYTNKEGHKVYTTNVVIETQEFAESKSASREKPFVGREKPFVEDREGFIEIPEDIDEDLPFS